MFKFLKARKSIDIDDSLFHTNHLPVVLRFLLAAGLVGAAFVAQLGLAKTVSLAPYPFIVFYPALFLSSLLCGTVPGFLATIAASLLGRYFFMAPLHQIAFNGHPGLPALLIFYTMGNLVVWICHRYRKVLIELEEAKKEATRSTEAKSAFLANMSHEIRTPLSAIRGFADLLTEGNFSESDRKRFLNTISLNSIALTKIIDDILDLAKVESGKLAIEGVAFNFHKLIDEVHELFDDRANTQGIFLEMNVADSVPSSVISDPTRLRQIMVNIIGNAIKFTKVGGVSVDVTSSDLGHHKERIKISVMDTGIGMSSEQREHLFQPFHQADNSMTRKFGGTGLGLALSKRLTEALGGTLTIETAELEKGSTFVILFEVLRSDVEVSDRIVRDDFGGTNSLEGLRVLVADDSLDNQYLVKRVLMKEGASVQTANTGRDAVTIALGREIDLVLMDLQMPVLDGFQAIAELRKADFTRPIIALTAHAMKEDRNRSLAAGFDDHVTKPLDNAELLSIIHKLIKKKK